MSNPWYQDPQWYAIIASILIALLSFFREIILNIFFRAKVNFEFKILSPNCHKTRLNLGDGIPLTNCYYYRLKVQSLNGISPRNLEMMVTRKLQKNGDEFIEDKSFLPMSLKWSHYGISVLDHIPPRLFKFCDFGFVIEPNRTALITRFYINKVENGITVLDMDLETKPFTGSNILTPGSYRFEIVLSGQNFNGLKKTFEINLPNYWNESEQEMLNNGLSVSEQG